MKLLTEGTAALHLVKIASWYSLAELGAVVNVLTSASALQRCTTRLAMK